MSEPQKKKSRIRVIGFALILSFICSALITTASVGLKSRQLTNMALDKRINILKAAGLMPEKRPSKEGINTLYDTHIQEVFLDKNGQIVDVLLPNTLTLFLIKNNGQLDGYILPITTRGLWGKIQGYLAFENDGQTIAGFSVFSHSETPGLGGEIESAWFENNFKGKKIVNSRNEFVSISIAKGRAENLPIENQANYVDGISGATLTGKYLSAGIKKTLIQANPVTVKFLQRQKAVSASSKKPAAKETTPLKRGE